jgi:hypothetical protein
MMISTATPTDAEIATQDHGANPADLLVAMLRSIAIDYSPDKSQGWSGDRPHSCW